MLLVSTLQSYFQVLGNLNDFKTSAFPIEYLIIGDLISLDSYVPGPGLLVCLNERGLAALNKASPVFPLGEYASYFPGPWISLINPVFTAVNASSRLGGS